LLLPSTDGRLDTSRIGLDLAVLRQYLWGKKVVPEIGQDGLLVMDGGDGKPLRIPHDGMATVDINFAGPPETFPTYKFHDVYFETMDLSAFKDCVVYIGSTSAILQDNKAAPFTSKDVLMPGVETHANLLDTIITGNFLKKYPPYVEIFLLLGLGALASLLSFRAKPWVGLVLVLGALSVFVIVDFYLFSSANMVLPLVSPLASGLLSYFAIAVYRGVVEENRAKATRAMFSRYVSHQIVDEILKNPGAVKLGGEVKEVSILFSDVRGFTAMSERLSAPEVVEVLNEYLTRMVDIVIDHNGTLDKYVGDAVMAVWGSPLADPQHARNSVRTAVLMMEALQELRAKWKLEGKPEMDIGIGINSGHVVAGNMGHPEYKMDYTVIGDDVNLAARLESANKELKAHVLISGTTYAQAEDLVEVVKHPDIHVKGKEKAVEVYEVIGWKGKGRADWAVPLKG
jgi:adenylate cyclase